MGGQTNESSVIALLSVLARTSSAKCSPLMPKARHARGAPWRRRPSLILHIHIWSYPSERVTFMNYKTLPQDEWQDTKQEFSVLLWLLQPALSFRLVSCQCRENPEVTFTCFSDADVKNLPYRYGGGHFLYQGFVQKSDVLFEQNSILCIWTISV